MYLPDFDYYTPETVAEACQLLMQYGGRAKVLSGGTDLLVKMKHGLLEYDALVSLKKLDELKNIYYVPGQGVIIGARVTLNELVYSELLQEKYPSVCGAARQMAANQVRNAGTIGGNICNGVPSADLPPILIALNSLVKIVGGNGDRIVPIENVFVGPNKTILEPHEILTEVIIPDQSTTGSTYIKFGLRKAGALAVVGVAVAVNVKDGVMKDVRVALGAVAPTPMRARETEEFLKGKEISDEVLAQAGVIASQECKPISDIRASEEYRRDLVRVFTKRALKKAIEQGHV